MPPANFIEIESDPVLRAILQGGADRRRPQHAAAGGHTPVPAVDDELRLDTRGSVGLELRGPGLDVEPSCSDAHGASIRASVSGVDRAPPSRASIIGHSFLLPPCNLSLDELRHAVVQVLIL
jgi:hypothetical protein